MILDQTITRRIDENLIAQNADRTATHKSSGKLSAGKLGWPLQWQILSSLGAEPQPFDAYTLRKFLRGNQVEEWLVTQIPGLIDKQRLVLYRDTIGYIDAYVDSSVYEFKTGKIPHEIKSVTNAKFSNITKRKSPDDGHCLQACLYALAVGSDYFAVDYVASDDLRVFTFIEKTKDYSKRVDQIITEFQEQLAKKEIPVFVPAYSWQKDIKYNSYPEWSELNAEEIKQKAERLKIKF